MSTTVRARTKALLLTLAASALVALAAVGAEAQCALCRSALEKAGEQTARTLNLGILVLLVPPVAIFCTIFVAAYRTGKGDERR
jgi:heme/copper-type cytochrome/quinol oxidase subunit 2